MTDEQRIEALVEEGRITREQADVLLAALEPSAPADTPATGDWFPDSVTVAAGDAPALYRAAPDPSVKWLELTAFGGDFDISVNDALQQPVCETVEPEITEAGARISVPKQARSGSEPLSFLDRIVDSFRGADLNIEIPAGWGVILDVKGGDVDIDGPVAGVRGRLLAGDLSVSDTASAVVAVKAGEAEIGLRASSGSHRVDVKVGQVDVRILPGSHLAVDASVSVGNVSGKGLNVSGSGIGSTGTGTLGSGAGAAGKLAVSVTTGDIRIRETE